MSTSAVRSASERLELFDAATERQRLREVGRGPGTQAPTGRGWTRDELYTRGRTD
jgi:hypothetical protein